MIIDLWTMDSRWESKVLSKKIMALKFPNSFLKKKKKNKEKEKKKKRKEKNDQGLFFCLLNKL